MGALAKRISSGVAIVAAILFVISSLMLFAGNDSLGNNSNSAALYVLTIAGILAIVFAITMLAWGSDYVRKASGALLLISGVLFLLPAFIDKPDMYFALAGILAGAAIIVDMLALWKSHIYGAMYVSAVLAAVVLVMGVMCFSEYDRAYAFVMLIVFAIWFVIHSWVAGLVKEDTVRKTREVDDSVVVTNTEKPMAKNKKATPKAKKAPVKKEVEASKDKPKEESKKEPQGERKARPVTLPNTPSSRAAIEKSQEKPAEVPKVEDKKEQKAPAKAMGDFMEKLMSSQDANRKVKETTETPKETPRPVEKPVEKPKEEPKVEIPKEEPKIEEPKIEAPKEEPKEEPKVEEPVEKVEEIVEVVEIKAVEMPEFDDSASVISEPVPQGEDSDFDAGEPNWDVVVRDSSDVVETKEEPEVKPVEIPKKEPKVETPVEVHVEEKREIVIEEVPREEPTKVEVPADPEVSVISEKVEIVEESEPEPEPDWGNVSTVTAIDEPETVVEVEETVVEEPIVEPIEDPVNAESSDDEIGVDVYTDNSPEALVRRAAWNKGLRCRRDYGDYKIPVAFVKGKVAVYVYEGESDTSMDEAIKAEGWTILRYNAADITDGKKEGDEIAATVKENTKTTKKRKSKK